MDLSKIDNDFQDDEIERINTYVSNGCIGLESVVSDDNKISSMFALYMQGRTYTEISKISKTKKDIVLYLGAKFNWYEKRMEYINDIQNKITKKLVTTRVESLNFISNLIGFMHKYYGDEFNRFMITGDRDIIDNLDLKMLSQYFKSIEILEKLMNPANVKPPKSSGATVNINAPDGAEVRQLSDDTLEITPSNSGDILKKLAKMKENQEKE
jgi:hypothetical protein